MSDLVRVVAVPAVEAFADREWLVTNGLGGYASGTIYGASTRRYHGLLIASLPAPVGRVVLLSEISERIRLPGGAQFMLHRTEMDEPDAKPIVPSAALREFRLEAGLPVWTYAAEGYTVEKRIVLPHMQNTVYVTYRLVSGDGVVRLKLQPAVQFRPHEAPVDTPIAEPYLLSVHEDRYELVAGGDGPRLRMLVQGRRATFTFERKRIDGVYYALEAARGYAARGTLWSPGRFAADLATGVDAAMIASTESWDSVLALDAHDALDAENVRHARLIAAAPPQARTGPAAELVLAADQFIITPAGRVEDAARAQAAGDESRTVIAGYHWFTDWGRDTMISLEGLTLCTGREIEAGWILRTFGHYVRDGLIPNLFPEGEKDGLYHTADATLWFFHALARYLIATNDRATLRILMPKLLDVVNRHVAGTKFGIGVDPADGLLRQGAEHYQLTWMDAKVEDWVVTPRRGKAVEINALWYNALRWLERWVEDEHRGSETARWLASLADRTYAAFNARFWCEERGWLYDVIDGENGDDAACRPNQVLAISLDHPVLECGRWQPVLDTVRTKLLTPVGLRSLAPDHADYKARYYGDLRARDAAYHQGTVWAWLIGPFIDAWLKVHPDDRAGARRALEGFVPHLDEACIGTISEIFDAEPPYTPRGCVAQAWSVAEALRCWVKTAPSEPTHDVA